MNSRKPEDMHKSSMNGEAIDKDGKKYEKQTKLRSSRRVILTQITYSFKMPIKLFFIRLRALFFYL